MSTGVEKSVKDRVEDLESQLDKLKKLLESRLSEHGIHLHKPKVPKNFIEEGR